MFVIKRNGTQEPFMINKIVNRIAKYGLNIETEIILNLNNQMYSGMQTAEIDNLISIVAIKLNNIHPNYGRLAANILPNNVYKQVEKSFSQTMRKMMSAGLLDGKIYEIILDHKDILDNKINHENDLSFKALEFHLMRKDGKIVERPQHMLMRVSIGLHQHDIRSTIETYELMSQRWFVHDSNTLLYAGTPEPVLSKSFQLTIKEDSLPGIYDTLKQTAILLKKTNDIGLNVHCIRSADSYIAGSNGYSNGLVSMLKVFNESSNYMCKRDHHGNKQKELCIYLEPWHADIFEFLDLKKNTGEANLRARELFYALWIPDLFMERVKADGDWSLMCPHNSSGLHEVWGDKFVRLYQEYESEGRFKRKVKARDLWNAIVHSRIEAGQPYIVYKDQCNQKSNQQNVGTIKTSNISAEIMQYSSSDEIAVCQSASIALHRFVNCTTYDFSKLKEITKIVTRNLNRIIDVTHYPLLEAERSNKRHRAISISVQGLADVFILMRYPFESDEARNLNMQIFETIYFGALEASCELAEQNGAYKTYVGSPVSKGILQFDMWNVKPTGLWNWRALKDKIKQHGVRNSLLLAQIESQLASELLECNPGCRPITGIYTTKLINPINSNNSNEIKIIKSHLLNDLIDQWDDIMMRKLLESNGSIQKITGISDDLKKLYRNAWEIQQKTLINMNEERAAFIDQSQTSDVYIPNYSFDKITSMLFYGWEKRLKTGLHRIHFLHETIQNNHLVKMNKKKTVDEKASLCTIEKQFKKTS